MNKSLILTYHNIVDAEKDLLLYDVRFSDFKKQVEIIRDANDAIRKTKIVLTFDDGYKSWANEVLDILRRNNLKAYFFVCIKHIEEGQISVEDILRLKNAGMTVGSHSVSHRYLNTLTEKQIYDEMIDSKRVLEKIVETEVRFFSVPYGNSSRRIIRAAQAAGYRAVFTSAPGINKHGAYALKRIAVKRDTGIKAFQNLVQGKGMALLRIQSLVKNCVKRVIGVHHFHELRNAVVERAE